MQHPGVMAIRSLLLLLAVLPLMLAPGLGSAQTFPAFTQTGTDSTLGWSVNTTRGWSFSVSSRIVVQQLGFWDSGQDGLGAAHAVGVWRQDGPYTGTLLTSATVPAGTTATLDATFRWVATTPIELLPGNVYVIGAYWMAGDPDNRLAGGENAVFDARVAPIEGRAEVGSGLGGFQRPEQRLAVSY